jgi:hypothetical protein
MNTKLFFILIAGFAFAMSSCNRGEVGTDESSDTGTYASDSETNPPGYGEDPSLKQSDSEEPGYPDGEQEIPPPVPQLDVILTIDDIISYNMTSEEIVFTDLIFKELTAPKSPYNRLILYYDDKPLFGDIKTCHPIDSNPWYGCVVLYIMKEFDESSGKWYGHSFRLHNNIGVWYEGTKITGEMKEDAKKLNAEWDIFIKYLRDTGKIEE